MSCTAFGSDLDTDTLPMRGGVSVPATILVVGSGAREHALCWRLRRDPGVERVLVAPGNPGHVDVADVRPGVRADDIESILGLCRAERVDLVVVGPESPLMAGLADRLVQAGIPVFGPTAAAAAIEGSKAFCRDVAASARIPMAEGGAFDDIGAARAYAASLGAPVVIKVDGLAAGKGVAVCQTLAEADAALEDALVRRSFGAAGARVVVERALIGPEASLIAICDRATALALPAARDHKRIGDGDRGPNTGGMGAYSPVADLDEVACARLVMAVHEPALREMLRRGRPFRGALYAGLMLTAGGPRLLEFNARFGDPETQVILPRLTVPLAPLLLAAATDRLTRVAVALGLRGIVLPAELDAAVGVVLAAPGYPAAPETGDVIDGLDAARADGALVFEAGTARRPDGVPVTAGGRVVTVVGRGPELADAADAAYRAADRITFRGRQLRQDIGRAPAGASIAASGTAA